MKIALVLAAFLLPLSQGLSAAITYSNPVLPGDFPDPSVVRVGDDYWATATSSEWGPIYPILHSRDLVNWEIKGTIFPKKPAWSSRNYWAPEISHYKGKFYVYYTARKNEKDGVLCIALATAENPEGPWTDHGPLVGQDEGSIDGVTAIDEHGERYLIWKGDGNSRGLPTIFYIQKLSEDGTRLIGEMKEILRNDAPWEGSIIEGPVVIRKNDWFYLFYAGGNGCCGKQCQYGEGVARSKSLHGPYEKNPRNPVLARNDKWRCPGHGTIVSTADGRDFLMYHAYAEHGTVYIGRQGMLDEIKWGADGWPTINQFRGPTVEAPSPHGKPQRVNHEFFDDFTSNQLGVRWQWPHSTEPIARIENGTLTLSSSAERGQDLFGSVLALQTTTADYAATAVLRGGQLKPGTTAGFLAFGDRQNALGLLVADGKVSILRRVKNKDETLASAGLPKRDNIYLRITATSGHRFEFSVWDGKDWLRVGENASLEGDFLPPWDRGVRIALTVGGSENASAAFDWVRVVPAAAAP